jgi:hypothetical protein
MPLHDGLCRSFLAVRLKILVAGVASAINARLRKSPAVETGLGRLSFEPFANDAVSPPIILVLDPSSPDEVVKPVVRRIPVEVAAFKARRARADERLEYESVNQLKAIFPRSARHRNPEMAIPLGNRLPSTPNLPQARSGACMRNP